MSLQASLELPAELLVQVMTYLETPRDLFAFIRTSKRVWQVFQGSQIAILIAVIENAIPDDNISVAVAACHAAQVSKLRWAEVSAETITQSQDDFIKHNPRGRASNNYCLRDWSLLLSLYKLWWISDYFLSCFVQDALAMATHNTILTWKQYPPRDLTSSERSRIQRALFRFEVYRRITPATITRGGERVPDGEWDRVRDILKLFPPWEREEILSVQEYLVKFVKDVLENLEDYVVREVSNMPRDSGVKSKRHYEPVEMEPVRRLEMYLDFGGCNVFNHFNERKLQYLVARGLPFIRWLSRLPPKHKIQVIVHYTTGKCSPSIFEQLLYHDREFALHDTEVSWFDENHAETSSLPSQGWEWARMHNFTTDERPLLRGYMLRRMGYVFWDLERLRDDWGLTLVSPAMLELPSRSYDDDDRDWGNKQTIEERFKGVTIPESALENSEHGVSKHLGPDGDWENKVRNGWPAPFSKEETEAFNIEY